MNAPAELSPEVLAQRQREVVQALMAVLPTHCLLYREEDTAAYECDGLAAYRRLPLAVALPETEAQVQRNRKRQRSEEHTSELQSPDHLVCRLLLEKKKK